MGRPRRGRWGEVRHQTLWSGSKSSRSHGRAPLDVPQDPWAPEELGRIRSRLTEKARELGLNLDNPRVILDEPELSKLLWPGVEKFFYDDEALKDDVRHFVSCMVAKGNQWRFKDALEYVKKHGVKDTIDFPLQPLIEFLSKCVCMDPINVDQALNVVFAFLTGNDHRIVSGSPQFRDDMPTVFIAGSGGGKSPMIIRLVLEAIMKQVRAIPDRIPGGLASFVTAGTNYPGWLVAVVRLAYRCCFLWEELFFGINKSGEKDKDKMSLESNIRCYNPLAVGGDLRATVDRQLQGDVKCSCLSGLQYKSFHEYLAGDTKGALERYHFCLSDIMTAKRITQEYRCAEKSKSIQALVDMLEKHVEHMFPPTVMTTFQENLKKKVEDVEVDNVEVADEEPGVADEGVAAGVKSPVRG